MGSVHKLGSFRCRLLINFFLAVGCLLLLSGSRGAAEPQGEAERILRSRVPDEIIDFVKQLQPNISLEDREEILHQIGEKKEWRKEKYLVKKHGQFYATKGEHEAENTKTGIDDLCYGINSKYCFELKKNKAGNMWVVSNCAFLNLDFNERKLGFFTGQVEGGFRGIADDSISRLVSIRLISQLMAYGSPMNVYPGNGIPAEKLFELPGFRLNSASLTGPNRNTLRINFTYEMVDRKTEKPCQPDSMLEFDLSMHCLPTKLHQSYKTHVEEVIYDWQREWVKTGDKSYTAKEIIEAKYTSSSTERHLFKRDMNINLTDIPESDFTLSAFGLPEPPGIEWEKPFPWYLVFAGIGTACLGVFFFLRARCRRLRGS